jgi:large subunit ribosomal protein L15
MADRAPTPEPRVPEWTAEIPEGDPDDVRLDRLAPRPGSRHARKRVGRGIGSGHGKTSGRGQKGLGARSGGGVREGYRGGQMPIYMQQGKMRGSNRKMSMPMGPFRTHAIGVNVSRLSVFEPNAVVDPEALAARGLVKNNANRDWPVKILAKGEIDRPLTVRAHAFSAAARAKIEAAGGTAEVLGAPAAAAAPMQGDGGAAAESPSPASPDRE